MVIRMKSRRMKRSGAGACLLATALGLCVAADARADFQGATHLMPFDEDTIHYSKSPATGPVARLQEQLDRGTTQLRRDATHGFLLSLLRELRVSTNSQMLVFSQTSFQRDRISPAHPRAVFFNDTVYVGYVPGSPLLEISTADPKLGAVFYTNYVNRVV